MRYRRPTPARERARWRTQPLPRSTRQFATPNAGSDCIRRVPITAGPRTNFKPALSQKIAHRTQDSVGHARESYCSRKDASNHETTDYRRKVPREGLQLANSPRVCRACRRRSPREDVRSHWKSRYITTIRLTPSITSNKTTFTNVSLLLPKPNYSLAQNNTAQDAILRSMPSMRTRRLCSGSRHGTN